MVSDNISNVGSKKINCYIKLSQKLVLQQSYIPSSLRFVTNEYGKTSFNMAFKPDTMSDLEKEQLSRLSSVKQSITSPFMVGQKCNFELVSHPNGSTGPSKFTASSLNKL